MKVINGEFVLSSLELPVKGKLEGMSDFVIDVNTLTVEEFLQKYC